MKFTNSIIPESALMEKAMKVASMPGYKEFLLMPIIAKIIGSSTTTEESLAKPTNQNTSQKGPAKDPSVLSSPNVTKNLKIKDSESEILAKYYNFLQDKYEFDKNKHDVNKKYYKEMNERKNKELEEMVSLMSGKTVRGKRAVQPKIKTKEKSNLLKYGLVGAAGLAAVSFSDRAMAAMSSAVDSIDTSKLYPDFSDTMKNIEKMMKDVGGIFGGKLPEDGKLEKIPSLVSGTPREAAEKYLGRKMTDKEFDYLLRATSAEAGFKSQEEVTHVMGAILNRARTRFGGQEGSVIKVLEETNQFQAVTGTRDKPGPSEGFKKPLSEMSPSRMKQIATAATSLSDVPTNLTDFTAANAAAYGAGTDISYRDKMLASGGKIIGETVFRMPEKPIFAEKMSSTLSQPMGDEWSLDKYLTKTIGQQQRYPSVVLNNNNVVNGGTNYVLPGSPDNTKDYPLVHPFSRR